MRFSVHDYWTDAHLLHGHKHFAARRCREALADYQAALEFPANLQTARTRWGGRYPEVAYRIGAAHEALGERDKAMQVWKEASADLPRSRGDDVLVTADRTVLRYFQALSLRKLGQSEKAAVIFQSLVRTGSRALEQSSKADFFAKFGQQQSQRNRLATAHYLAALG